jgi:hypothetical protein
VYETLSLSSARRFEKIFLVIGFSFISISSLKEEEGEAEEEYEVESLKEDGEIVFVK